MATKTPRDKHEIILGAAQKRFARFGLAKVTMDEIAADLGMSKAALYYYFPTKEDMFRSVVATEQKNFIERIEAVVRGTATAARKLSGYFTEHLRLQGSLLDMRIIEARVTEPVKPIMRDLFRKFSITETRYLETIIREGKRRHEFCVDFPQGAARLIQHALQGLRIRFFKTMGDGEPKPSDIRAYRDEVLYFLEIFLKAMSPQRSRMKNA
ncbi:MAG TPA: TetR/AcrR family transcriptional regulator [Chitinivibrionales bacterium]|nr:TetR/AcrR family transcriptional regulator [Chitinivibrionales bacterium]